MMIWVPPLNVFDGSMLTLGEMAEIERDGMLVSYFEVPEIRQWFARNNPQHSHACRTEIARAGDTGSGLPPADSDMSAT